MPEADLHISGAREVVESVHSSQLVVGEFLAIGQGIDQMIQHQHHLLGFHRRDGIYTLLFGVMEKKMETTIVYWGYIGIMEKKMATTT